MDTEKIENTVSESREESLRKAVAMLEQEERDHTPLRRPKISLSRVLIGFFLWIALCNALVFLIVFFGKKSGASALGLWFVCFVSVFAIFCLRCKSLICSLILIYQRYAPERLRRACVFTPSCSEYMLLSIEKYGVVRGVPKGVGRLLRCHPPNGGVDEP